MTLKEAMKRLAAMGEARVRPLGVREGVGGDLVGVKLGDIRKLAKDAGSDHALGLELWASRDPKARLLAVLVLKPKALSAAELDAMVRDNRVLQIADWLSSYAVKAHPGKEALRQAWMADDDAMTARAGWSLTAERVGKNGAGLDLTALLDRIEAEMAGADPVPRWTMKMALAMIGIHHREHRARALAIGERLGVYRDFPVSPGCTSPFAPEWIGAMARREGAS